MNWRDFRRKEGKITITSVSVSLLAFASLSLNFKSKQLQVHKVLKCKIFSITALMVKIEIHLDTSIKPWSYILCTSNGAAGTCARAAQIENTRGTGTA